jgi:NADH dehydrogenase FAD-containing subunit
VAVKEVRDGEVVLSNGEIIKCGMVVWSTGVAPTKFIKNLAA